MKVIVVFAILSSMLCTSRATAVQRSEVIEDNGCQGEAHFEDPDNPQQYYKCVLNCCPGNSVWDKDLACCVMDGSCVSNGADINSWTIPATLDFQAPNDNSSSNEDVGSGFVDFGPVLDQ